MSIIKKPLSIILLALLVVFIGVNIIGTGFSRKVFIDGDGSGHYAYLPSVLIYKSVDFKQVFDFEKSKRPNDYMGHYFHKVNDIFINKYTTGTALLQLPFFILAFLISLIFGLPTDGYSIVFQYAVAIATLFWIGVGLLYTSKLMSLYGISKYMSRLLTAVLLFSTNLFFYTFIEPSFSHAYSFAVIAVFIYYLKLFFDNYSLRQLLILSFLLGIIVLIRPANVLVLTVIPFVSGSYDKLLSAIKLKLTKLHFIPALLVFIIAISPQLIINYLQTGSFIIYGYKNEGFYFNDPQIINFLISYKKGWFVYTPIFLLIVPALIYLFRTRKLFVPISFVTFLIIIVYIFSSWWNWYYGDSFGMRPLVDYYSILFLPICLFISDICKNWVRYLVWVFIIFTIILNLVQSYQYAIGIIHADSMTKQAYWYVFMDTGEDKVRSIACGNESYFGKLSDKPFFQTSNDIEGIRENWVPAKKTNENIAYSGSKSVYQTSEIIYSPSFKYKFPDTLVEYNNIFVFFDAMYFEPEINAAKDALFVVDISDANGKNIFYKTFNIKRLPDNTINEWRKASIGFKLPEIANDMDYAKFYIWNINKQSYLLDDLSIKLHTYN